MRKYIEEYTKKYLTHKNLPFITLGAGLLGFVLRLWQLNTRTDAGFILRGHISGILLAILTAIFLVAVALASRPLVQANKYDFNFPASVYGAAGCIAGAACFALTSILAFINKESTVVAIVGLVAAGALVFAGKCRLEGQHPSALFHIVICVYLVLRLLALYRMWSADPQLADYCYPLLAMVFLMLTAYHRATFNANFGQRRSYTLFNLAAVYFCFLSVAGPKDIFFYLGAGCWLVTDQCNLTPMPHRFMERKNETT